MDPTAQEILAMGGLEDVRNWVGMRRGLVVGFDIAMGECENLREVCAVPQAMWDEAVQHMRFVTVEAAGEIPEILGVAEVAEQLDVDGAVLVAGVAEVVGQPLRAAVAQADRPLNGKEAGQVGTFRRVCRLRLGLGPTETETA